MYFDLRCYKTVAKPRSSFYLLTAPIMQVSIQPVTDVWRTLCMRFCCVFHRVLHNEEEQLTIHKRTINQVIQTFMTQFTGQFNLIGQYAKFTILWAEGKLQASRMSVKKSNNLFSFSKFWSVTLALTGKCIKHRALTTISKFLKELLLR